MGVGASRLAYRCRVTDGCYKGYTEGSYCIYKVVKPDSIYDGLLDEVSDRDVDMQLRAKDLAIEFNAAARPTKNGEPCEITIRDAKLGSFDDGRYLSDDTGSSFHVPAGQAFLLEREIRGSFEKFSSNSGWQSGDDPIIEAFSHWSWCHTEGNQLVCDCHGHRGNGPSRRALPHLGHDYYYLLTDPAICSVDRAFGESDIGQRGIDAFFANHVCNEWCEKLDIEYERPQYCNAAIPRQRSTSYNSLLARY
jgi:hypothetical protein